jgi:transposase
VAQNFIACDRDQQYLMPPSLAEWLPEGHLAWFVLDAVSQMDLGAFYARYRDDGWGRAAYDPAMMVALVLYSYCIGERSARRIERRLHEDVAYRVIAANQAPDHATIARFRQEHEDALAGLFTECLRLCVAAGLGKVGVVAIDGTKMAAAAALSANRTNDAIAAEARRIMAEAKATDEAEDALYGKGVRGDELPPELANRTSRLARLREAKKRLEEEDAARERAHAERLEERARIERRRGKKLRGRKPRPPAPDPLATANTTDPQSRILWTRQGYLQGYNAQAAVSGDQIILAAELTQQENDVGQLHPMIAATEKALCDAGVSAPIGAVLADAGYMSDQNLADADPQGPELLIATTTAPKQRAAQKERAAPRGRIPKAATPRQRMQRKLLTKRGQALYRMRAQTVEPVFGQIKDPRGIRRFIRRGLAACQSEWRLISATHNLLKLFRHGQAGAARRHGSLPRALAAA